MQAIEISAINEKLNLLRAADNLSDGVLHMYRPATALYLPGVRILKREVNDGIQTLIRLDQVPLHPLRRILHFLYFPALLEPNKV